MVFPGYFDQLSASYGQDTVQLFGELGYQVRQGGVGLEPFLNLAYVNVSTDGFVEQGGAAALVGQSGSSSMGFSTLGMRATGVVYANGGNVVTARGLLGWRYGFGDAPTSTLSFVGGTPFAVTGVPVEGNSAVMELGLDSAVTQAFTVGLAYAGQFGDTITDNGVLANARWRF